MTRSAESVNTARGVIITSRLVQLIATMLWELRKYRISLILANQYRSQVEPEVHDAVFGNVGTVVSFRVDLMMRHSWVVNLLRSSRLRTF